MSSDSTTPSTSYVRESLREISLGCISGALGKVVEFPFDTMKVRMQYSQSLPVPLFDNTLDCIYKTYRNEGIFSGFYKGIASPLVGAAMEFATLFWTYDLAKIFISKAIGISNKNNDDDLQLKYKLVAGGISGVVTSFVLTPVELIKCQMQIDNLGDSKLKKDSTILKMIKSIYKRDNAGLMNFWRGQSMTAIRETGGTMFWFGAYEYLTSVFEKLHPGKGNTTLELLISGAASGVTYNVSFYPIDTIKSVMQTTEEKSYMKIAKDIYSKGGVKRFYTGCGITAIRAIPSSSLIFFVYETLKKNFV